MLPRLLAVFALAASTGGGAGAEELPGAMYTQDVEITFASAAEAAAASPKPVPVYDGKPWALTARWDDNHPGSLLMREAMAKHGLKGTFYVNDEDDRGRYGEPFVRELMRDGFTLGGHSRTHPFLPMLGPNELFVEILANRVQREAQADAAIVSFAFPFGAWDSKADPQAATRITEALRRAGLHHNTYSQFATNNPNVKPNEFSACHMIQPGDSVVDRDKFETNLEKFFKFPAAYQKMSYAIALGTHARQSGEAWAALDAIFADLKTKTDWWICTQNEYAAYHRQVHRSTIDRIRVDGAVATFRLTRPTPAESGAMVPLTMEVGGTVSGVNGGGAEHTWRAVEGRTLINLAHDAVQTLPKRIDAIDNIDNIESRPDHGQASEMSGLRAWLWREASGELSLELTNRSGTDVTEMSATLRLPLAYEPGVVRMALTDLPHGSQRRERFVIGTPRASRVLSEGPLYFVAELDFVRGGERERLFATATVRQPSPVRDCVRDAAAMIGPFDASESILARLREASQRTRPPQGGEGPTEQWFRATPEDRQRFVGERLTLFRDDAAWLAATKPFNGRPHGFAACIDFRMAQSGPITLRSEMSVTHLFLNGVAVPTDQPMTTAQEGENRLVVVFNIADKRTYWKPMPVWFEMQADGGNLSYLLPVEQAAIEERR